MALKALASGSTAQGSISSAANTSIFTHNTSTYAVVTKNQTGQGTGGFVVLNISDPDNPTIVSEITDSTTGTNDNASNDWELLNGALDVETVVIGGVPYAVIAQRLNTASSAGGFTVVKLTDSSGNITSSSPSVVKQVQDGEAFAGSLNAALSNVAAISTETIGSTTYLFTVGTNSADKGTFQVYDLNKLISNDNTALIKQIEDNDANVRIDNPTDIETNIVGDAVYAYITSERGAGATVSYLESFSFEPSTSIISPDTSYIESFDDWDFFSSASITNGSESFWLFSEEKRDNSETHLYNFEVTDGFLSYPASTGTAGYRSNVESTSSSVTLDDVNQLSSAEFENKFYFIAPNAGSTNKGVEAIEVNMSSGALASEGSIAIDGASDVEGGTFSSLDGATDFAPFSIGSSTYGLVTAKTDQAIQIVRLIHVSSLSSATYDFSTGTLIVTGEDLLAKSGGDNDINVSQITLTGEDSNTYTLTSSDVEIDSATQFTVTLNAADQLQLAGLLNKDGTSSGGSTTYNIAATSGWNPGNTWSPDDLTGNAITVSNVAAPTLTSATYDASTGALVITGTNLPAYPGPTNDVDVSALTITGEGGSTYTLTSDDVELSSATSATVPLNSTDQTALAPLLDNRGTSSSGGTTYNIAAANRWVPGADANVDISDLTGNGITVFLNRAPVLTDPTAGIIIAKSGSSDTTTSGITGTLSASDPDGDILTYGIIGGIGTSSTSTLAGTYGSLAVKTTTGAYTYTPKSAAIEKLCAGDVTDLFTVSVSDGTVERTSTYKVNITGADNPAFIFGDVTGIGAEDSTIRGTLFASDVEGLADNPYSISTTPSQGTASIDETIGAWTYTPTTNFNGADSFNVTVTDDCGGTTTQAIDLTVNPCIIITPTPSATDDATSGTGSQTTGESQVISNTCSTQTGTAVLVENSGNNDNVVTTTLPPSVSLTVEGSADAQSTTEAQETLIASIGAKDSSSETELINAAISFIQQLPQTSKVDVRTITPSTTSSALEQPIAITGSTGPATQTEAFVIDLRQMPAAPPTQLKLNNIAFSVIIGPTLITGGSGSNIVVADNAPQRIVLGEDDDTLDGGGGNDTIGSAGGDDLLIGGQGRDLITGGADNDTLHGSSGDDVLNGDANHDLLKGGGGDDSLFGGTGKDTLHGSSGDDVLNGDAKGDLLKGNSGNDSLFGGKGKDTLIGGDGADIFELSKQKDTINDFSIADGDVIEAPDNLSLRLIQRGDHLLLKDSDENIKTMLLNINSDELLAHQPELFG